MKFSPCRGGNNCTEGGTHCEGCGRSQTEVAETRQLINGLAEYAAKMGYENVEEFMQFVAAKATRRAMMLAAAPAK